MAIYVEPVDASTLGYLLRTGGALTMAYDSLSRLVSNCVTLPQ